MLAFALAMLLVGWLLVWAAITGSNPLDEIRSAFGAGPSGGAKQPTPKGRP